MSYAIESKKRKFHRILESISKPAVPENASKQAAGPATAPVHDRIPANLSIKKVRLSSNDSSDFTSVRDSILKTTRRDARISSVSSTQRPTFVPWDRDVFLERLETFRRVDRWTSKPTPINEVQWAKRGWICTDVMRVSCVSGCGGSVVVKLPDEIDELDGYDVEKVQERKEVRAKLVEEYEKLLRDGHGENCPWRSKSCDATIQHLPLTNVDVALSGLRDRYFNLVKMGDQLPSAESITTPEGLDLDGLIKTLPDDWSRPSKSPETTNPHNTRSDENAAQTSTEASQAVPETSVPPKSTSETSSRSLPEATVPINRAALALSLFGWNTVADGAAGLVGCRACFRRLGLWMYKPKANGDVTVYSSLDAATEHMEYCPWIDKVAQSGTGKPNENLDHLRAGWEAVAEAVKVKHRRRLRATTSTTTLRTEPSTPPRILEGAEDEEKKKKADREWWAKIRRVRQVLTAKSPQRKTPGNK